MRMVGRGGSSQPMPRRSRTFLVECYLPGIVPAEVAAAGERARSAAEAERNLGHQVEYLGAILVNGDEVVFHRFAATDAEVVETVCRTAGLRFERVVESIDVEVGQRIG